MDGKDYYFISADDFRRRINGNEFIEWEEVYKDHFYGTLKSEIDRINKEGKTALFDVDVMGGINLKRIFGNDALAIFIMPPSVNELRTRLIKRGTDKSEKITMRIEKASSEIKLADKFDRIIINDNLNKACKEIETVVTDFLKNR